MKYIVYILRTNNNHLYIGQTCNLENRLKLHSRKSGAKFIKDNQNAFKLVFREEFRTLIEAMRREKQLKGWTRIKKECLICGDLEKLKSS